MQHFREIDVGAIEVLLCDADGNLFPSEKPAFDASVGVTNRFLQRYGLPGDLRAADLLEQTTGKNFRTTAVDLAVAGGVPVAAELAVGRDGAVVASQRQLDAGEALTVGDLEEWVREERAVVTAHLGVTLTPHAEVLEPLRFLSGRYSLTAVSSSASARLDACFEATGLDALMPAAVRFSAEDSLPVPTSKPDPAVYLFAGQALGIRGSQGLAIEDSVPGTTSAVAAGFPTVGNVMFVPEHERARRSLELQEAGASAIVESWADLSGYLTGSTPSVSLVEAKSQ
ncbi:HAD family hydrolase [Mycolicibacterium sp. GCM10028919]|uniref:HAD family hydrolase n=1 Tax=Mycolicibacterium sp. GCM10028919 TaxID=3273401 RepID=UPI00360D9BA3